MKRTARAALLCGLVLSTALPASARAPQWWGLAALAVSPDGKTIVTGGQTRVLYALDAATLRVTRRIWFETRLGWASYNKDGSVLVIEDEREYLHFLNAKTYEKITVLPRCYVRAHHRSADLLATIKRDRKERKKPPYIRFLSLTDGSEKGQARLPAGGGSHNMTFTPDARRLLVLVGRKDPAEKTVKRADIPKDLKGLARDEFQQKHDGRTSKLLTFEVPSGKLLTSVDMWYASRRSPPSLVVDGNDVLVFQELNVNARISPDGKVTLFRTGIAGNRWGVAEDHKAIIVCSWGRAIHVQVAGMKETPLGLKAGTITGITFLPDGSAYLVTANYRLCHISKDGKLRRIVPVY